MFSFGFTSKDLAKVIWTFIGAFIVSFAAAANGWSALPSFQSAKAAVIAAAIAGGAAAFSFVKNLIFSDSSALKG